MPSKTEQLYGIEIQDFSNPKQTRLLWHGFNAPYITAHHSAAVKAKREAKFYGWLRPRVVKLTAKFTWLLLACWTFDVRCSTFDVQSSKSNLQGSTVSALIPPAIPPRTYYFAATAVSPTGLESDYSAEVSSTNPTPALAWDPSSTPACTYTIWRGREPLCYTNHWTAGTACVFSVPAVPLATNRILTLTTLNATGLQYRPWGGTWFYAGRTNLTLTNPPVGLQYRPLGRPSRPARAYITITHQ